MQKEHYAYLDTSRISLMVLGVFFHAATMFGINDDSFVKFDTREQLLGQLAGVVHTFRMEAFFILAAFLGSAMLDRNGGKAFVQKRIIRLVPPFATGLFIQHLSSLVLDGQPLIEDYPVVQYLWFLPALLMIGLLQPLILSPRWIDRMLPSTIQASPWVAVPVITAATALACFVAEIALKFFGFSWLTTATGGVFAGNTLAHYLPIYAVGTMLYARRAHLDRILTAWPTLIPLALFNFSKLDALNNHYMAQFAQIVSALGFTGIVIAMFRLYVPQSWSKRWMSNFSFSLYLLHQPILCLLRLPIMDAVHDTYARYCILVAATIAICTLLHLVIVRSPLLSLFFNGETRVRSQRAQTAQASC